MSTVNHTTFWSVVTILTSTIGGIAILTTSHANEPRHSEAAHEEQVSTLKVKVERVATNVEHNTRILDEVKADLKELRQEQRAASERILEAISEQ